MGLPQSGPFMFRSGGGGSASGSSVLSVTTKTTTYTATTNDDVILCDTSGGGWTLTLYAASGNSGRVLRIKKTTTDLNALTIDGNSSENIDGAATTTINTVFEELTIVCDGSNWHVLDRLIPSQLTTYTPTFSNLGTVSSVNIYSWRVGRFLGIGGNFTTGTVAGGTASMSLGFNGVDGGLTIATNPTAIGLAGVLFVSITTNPAAKELTALMTGGGTVLNFSFVRTDAAVNPLAAQTGTAAFLSSTKYSLNAYVPISTWNG